VRSPSPLPTCSPRSSSPAQLGVDRGRGGSQPLSMHGRDAAPKSHPQVLTISRQRARGHSRANRPNGRAAAFPHTRCGGTALAITADAAHHLRAMISDWRAIREAKVLSTRQNILAGNRRTHFERLTGYDGLPTRHARLLAVALLLAAPGCAARQAAAIRTEAPEITTTTPGPAQFRLSEADNGGSATIPDQGLEPAQLGGMTASATNEGGRWQPTASTSSAAPPRMARPTRALRRNCAVIT